MLIIDTPNDRPRRIRNVQLDDTVYRLRLTWSARRGSWYMDLLTLDGTVIMSGRRISPGGVPIPSGVPGAPGGIFFVTGTEDPYKQTDLGTSMELYYVPEDEVAEFVAEADAEAESEISVL